MISVEQLQNASDTIKKARPAYEPVLDFYTQVFTLQELNRSEISIPPILIDADTLKTKQENEMPLIDQSGFAYDIRAGKNLFDRICTLACNSAPGLSSSARTLKKEINASSLQLKNLFDSIITGQDSALHELAKGIDIPEKDLVFFGYLSIAPAVRTCAMQLEAYLDAMPDFQKGYCPVCGNLPDLAFLKEDGTRHLKCCFCSHEWKTSRMGCIFCGNNDQKSQHYFFSDEEKEYRVNLCDNCRSYIKTVDLRQMNRAFYPPLEQIATIHLDMIAQEKGYINSGQNNSVSRNIPGKSRAKETMS
jgi:FdhE protein